MLTLRPGGGADVMPALSLSHSHSRSLSRLSQTTLDLHASDLSPPPAGSSDGSVASSSKRQGRARATRVHAVKTALWVAVAAVVAVAVGVLRGRQRGLEFATGYLVEYSLSVDNLFVFLLIFKYFKVPREAQESVLFWGIAGAMVLRGVMSVCGKALVQRFEWVAVGFAVLLIYSAGKLLLEDDDEAEDLAGNRVIRFSKALLPVADRYIGEQFFVVENGVLMATPLMVVLVAIELSDVVFALDSVPAVLGISSDMFVIYVSNVLAIMGLRSLFFVLAASIGNLRFLKQALSIVLVFIGTKMIAGCLGYDFGVALSLAVVVVTLGGGVALSVWLPLKGERERGEGESSDGAVV